MLDNVWVNGMTATGESVMGIAGMALAVGLIFFGLREGIKVGIRIWLEISG